MNKSKVECAKIFGYDPSLIYILEGHTEEELSKHYPETYNNLKSCQYASDNRPLLVYASSLIENWMFEDYVVRMLSKAGLNIELSGNDKNRKILKQARVGQTPDTLVKYNGKSIYMEIIRNNTDYWTRTGTITNLRDNKVKNLKSHGALCLCMISKEPMKYLLIDFRKDVKFGSPSFNRGIGNKIQTPLSLRENNFEFSEVDWNRIKDDIIKLIEE